jgi:phage gpG-like protein
MSASYEIQLNGTTKLLNKLDAATKDSLISSSLTTGAILLSGWVKRNRLTGPRPNYLGVNTGRLRASITFSKAQRSGNVYSARIGTNVVYAPIHEFGLTVNKISKRGKPFTATYPKRAFLGPALDDEGNKKDVLNIFVKNINEALEK